MLILFAYKKNKTFIVNLHNLYYIKSSLILLWEWKSTLVILGYSFGFGCNSTSQSTFKYRTVHVLWSLSKSYLWSTWDSQYNLALRAEHLKCKPIWVKWQRSEHSPILPHSQGGTSAALTNGWNNKVLCRITNLG